MNLVLQASGRNEICKTGFVLDRRQSIAPSLYVAGERRAEADRGNAKTCRKNQNRVKHFQSPLRLNEDAPTCVPTYSRTSGHV